MFENQVLFPTAGDREDILAMRAPCFTSFSLRSGSTEEQSEQALVSWGGENRHASLPVSLSTIKTVSKPCLALK